MAAARCGGSPGRRAACRPPLPAVDHQSLAADLAMPSSRASVFGDVAVLQFGRRKAGDAVPIRSRPSSAWTTSTWRLPSACSPSRVCRSAHDEHADHLSAHRPDWRAAPQVEQRANVELATTGAACFIALWWLGANISRRRLSRTASRLFPAAVDCSLPALPVRCAARVDAPCARRAGDVRATPPRQTRRRWKHRRWGTVAAVPRNDQMIDAASGTLIDSSTHDRRRGAISVTVRPSIRSASGSRDLRGRPFIPPSAHASWRAWCRAAGRGARPARVSSSGTHHARSFRSSAKHGVAVLGEDGLGVESARPRPSASRGAPP